VTAIARDEIPPVIGRYIEGLKAHDVERVAGTVADDLAFVTPARTMAKPQFLAFLRALYAGFRDWRYDHDPPRLLAGGRVAVRWRQGGTHTATLALPGFDAVPATGRTVAIPEHDFFYQVANGLIVEIRPDPVPGGAPRGIFEQIGIALPPL
jgi:SnoaL-like domain